MRWVVYVVDDGGEAVVSVCEFTACTDDVEFGVCGQGAEEGEGDGGEMHGGGIEREVVELGGKLE